MGLKKLLIPGEQGQALVEFSFICVILLMLAGGVADGISVIRYNIALHGAAAEVVNQISFSGDIESRVDNICRDVIDINFRSSLGDGNTHYSSYAAVREIDSMTYHYRDQTHHWSGSRAYIPVTVTLERNQELISPFGQLFFGDPGNGGRRYMKVTARARAYLDIN